MHYSGILVTVVKERMTECLERLEALPGIEVHYVYPESGRVIVVQETETRAEQEDGLRHLQKQPDVLMAELAYHHIEHSDTEMKNGAAEDGPGREPGRRQSRS